LTSRCLREDLYAAGLTAARVPPYLSPRAGGCCSGNAGQGHVLVGAFLRPAATMRHRALIRRAAAVARASAQSWHEIATRSSEPPAVRRRSMTGSGRARSQQFARSVPRRPRGHGRKARPRPESRRELADPGGLDGRSDPPSRLGAAADVQARRDIRVLALHRSATTWPAGSMIREAPE
jgi:hypothetical protein